MDSSSSVQPLQKQLELEIKALRSNLIRQEKKVKALEEKESRLGEDRKRKIQEDQNGATNKVISPTVNKRLRSVVVTKNDVKLDRTETKELDIKQEASDTPAASSSNSSVSSVSSSSSVVSSPPVPHSTTPNENKEARRSLGGGDKTRDRRLLGALLVGTLNSFKKSEEEQQTTAEKRKEVEKKIEENETTKNVALREQQKQAILEERKKSEEAVQAIREQIQSKEEELLKLTADQHEQELSFYVKTKANPPLYFFPSKTDEFTERVLGTKPRLVAPLADTSVPTNDVAAATGAGNEDANSNPPNRIEEKSGNAEANDVDGDVEIEEITRAPEEFPAVHREEPSQEDIEESKKL